LLLKADGFPGCIDAVALGALLRAQRGGLLRFAQLLCRVLLMPRVVLGVDLRLLQATFTR
jgi:hypothetical protein